VYVCSFYFYFFVGFPRRLNGSGHAWKFRCSASCLSLSVQHVFNTKFSPYSAVFELDKRIRKFPLPLHLQSPVPSSENSRPWSRDPPHAMQQYCVVCERESSENDLTRPLYSLFTYAFTDLLYIHRSYFAQAIRESSANPLKHEYAPSVLATFRSASRIISSLKGLYAVHPVLTSRVWFFWSGTFSSCVRTHRIRGQRNAFHTIAQLDRSGCSRCRKSWMQSGNKCTSGTRTRTSVLRRRFTILSNPWLSCECAFPVPAFLTLLTFSPVADYTTKSLGKSLFCLCSISHWDSGPQNAQVIGRPRCSRRAGSLGWTEKRDQ
jgi:hypothetical protein